MRLEVQTIIGRVSERTFAKGDGGWLCPLCPFRTFPTKRCLLEHIHLHHSERKQYVASGTKQLKAVAALFDDDRLSDNQQFCFLSRSAELLRTTVVPALNSRHNHIDDSIRLVLSENGPVFVNLEFLEHSRVHRRVRNLYYTQKFAEILRFETITHKARVSSFLPRLVTRAKENGNSLCGLFPRHTRSWWPILEDIFQSPAALALRRSCAERYVAGEEYESISLDATLKVCLAIKGQAHYRCSQAERQQAAFGDSESLRRVLTARGRTGAVLLMTAISSESAPDLAAALNSQWVPQAKQQVKFVATDSPSPLLWNSLRPVLPNIQIMSLDPVHLAIVYEYSTWKKRSPGSTFLRLILRKLTAYDATLSERAWGPVYCGDAARPLSREENTYRDQILNRDMSAARATRVQASLDPNTPFYARLEMIEAIAALCALYPDEVLQSAHPTFHAIDPPTRRAFPMHSKVQIILF